MNGEPALAITATPNAHTATPILETCVGPKRQRRDGGHMIPSTHEKNGPLIQIKCRVHLSYQPLSH